MLAFAAERAIQQFAPVITRFCGFVTHLTVRFPYNIKRPIVHIQDDVFCQYLQVPKGTK
jgi:hypothetical protein